MKEKTDRNIEEPRYIRPVAGALILLAGLVFMLIPFIPLGYIMLLGGLFLLAPYIPGAKKIINTLKKKDKQNRVDKAEKIVTNEEKKISDKIKNVKSKNNKYP